jgi:hypothetical protein
VLTQPLTRRPTGQLNATRGPLPAGNTRPGSSTHQGARPLGWTRVRELVSDSPMAVPHPTLNFGTSDEKMSKIFARAKISSVDGLCLSAVARRGRSRSCGVGGVLVGNFHVGVTSIEDLTTRPFGSFSLESLLFISISEQGRHRTFASQNSIMMLVCIPIMHKCETSLHSPFHNGGGYVNT